MEIKPGEVPPWGEMRDKIREWLSQRDLVRDATGELHELDRPIRAQISDRDRPDREVPLLLVDDLEVSWEELGRLVVSRSANRRSS